MWHRGNLSELSQPLEHRIGMQIKQEVIDTNYEDRVGSYQNTSVKRENDPSARVMSQHTNNTNSSNNVHSTSDRVDLNSDPHSHNKKSKMPLMNWNPAPSVNIPCIFGYNYSRSLLVSKSLDA